MSRESDTKRNEIWVTMLFEKKGMGRTFMYLMCNVDIMPRETPNASQRKFAYLWMVISKYKYITVYAFFICTAMFKFYS